MPIPPSIAERVETFRRNLDSYLAPDYKEAELRREFLDPFFAALGWDVSNRAGHAEAYKDVVHEDTLKISGDTKAPDYSFRIGGTRKFFVEAKKPSVKIKDDPEPAKQLRRYSYSAGLPLGIVTDFHEFAIYDGRTRPKEIDKASAARLFYCTFEDYPAKWDEIAGIFAKGAVLNGSFDKYAATSRGKRGTAEFDDDFLDDMEAWRKRLAENFALRNSGLTQRDLNFAVQRILDRIIFLRIAEDRGIERLGQLQALTAGPKIYPRFCDICRHADLRYNSGLFHFETEKGRDESPDRFTLGLTLDDPVLKEIISSLYYPKSPYAFAVIPADTLGRVYEQFLGKVIHLTEGHRARIEEKPEVRKAGGVYYTPTYIVNYVVAQTVGPLVEGKTPRQIEKLRILDPACGSGSFLLGTYEFLLDWHLRYYFAHDPAAWAKKKQPPIYETAPNAPGIGRGSGNWQLTTAERKRILVNNLFGVDIDSQAVEVTKLSLLLKVLEGEAREQQGQQLDFHRVLPDLGHNIKCGNSLIGSDFYQQPNLPAFDGKARYKLNAFDWTHEFKPIMEAGGFDAVIGNPPYVLLQDDFRNDAQLAYFKARFAVSSFKIDTYHLFFERGIKLLKENGCLGYITPSNFLTNNHLAPLRRFILAETQPREILAIDEGVFAGASVDTGVSIFQRTGPARTPFPIRFARVSNGAFCIYREARVDPRTSQQDENVLFTGGSSDAAKRLWAKCQSLATSLGELAFVNFGKQLRDRRKFTEDVLAFDSLASVPSTHRPCFTGRDVARYAVAWNGLACLSDPVAQSGGCWDEQRHQAKNKLLTRQIGKIPVFGSDKQGFDCLNTLFMVSPRDERVCSAYLLGILNSKLTAFLWTERFYDKRNTFPKIKGSYLKLLPIRDPAQIDRATHDTFVAHVERMVKLHDELVSAKSSDTQTHLQREIAVTDRVIDRLVYQLYGLTDDEIAIVEQATASVASPSEGPATAKTPSRQPAGDRPGGYTQAELDAAHIYVAEDKSPKE